MATGVLPARRSRFVTLIAWFGIVSGVMGSVTGCLFVVTEPGLSSLVLLLSAVASLVTSLGLRERREWARRGLIAVLGYAIVMGCYGALRTPLPQGLAAQLPPDELAAMTTTMRRAMVGGAVIIGLVNGLIIARLCSRRVRREFGAD